MLHGKASFHGEASTVQHSRPDPNAEALPRNIQDLTPRRSSAPQKGEVHDDMLQRLDARLVEIDHMLATLRAQRKDLLAVRAQMEASWAEGECLDAGSVTLTPV